MSAKILDKCPVCGKEMIISTLKCKNCGIEINGEFNIDSQTTLFSEEDMSFIKTFFKYEGNFTKVQAELDIGYVALKAKIKDINIKLGNKEEIEMSEYVENVSLNNVGKASQRIIEKFSECGGVSLCDMIKGDPLKIWLTADGVKNSGFPQLVCEWAILDAIVDKAKELGGRMYRGDSAAQNGAKIGSEALPLDTIDSFISIKYYGKKEGESTLRRSTYYAAILAWAGICKNYRSNGMGGYIELNPQYK